MTDFVFPDQRRLLATLLESAESGVLPGMDAAYVMLLHATGDGSTPDRLTGWMPLEVKANFSEDGGLTYLVVQDARAPTRMESRLSNLLLYTSARPW